MTTKYSAIENDAMIKNEQEVNKIVLRAFKLILFIFPLSIALKLLKIALTPWSDLLIICLLGTFICLVPILYSKFSKLNKNFKIIAIVFSVLLATLFYSLLFVNVILFWLFPIGIACLYFDTNMVKLASILVLPGFIIGEVFSSLTKQQFLAGFQWIPLHVIIFFIQFFVLYKIFISFTKRARGMLFSAEDLLLNINNILKDTNSTSESLKESVTVLIKNMDESSKATEQISSSIKFIENDSKNFLENINTANFTVDKITENISTAKAKTEDIMNQSKHMIKMSSENKDNLFNSIKEIEQIEIYTDTAKKKVLALSENSQKIKEAISLITEVTKETNLLSLNASIEAARAGEAGRGFGVVAMQIKKLSNESHESTKKIEEVLSSTFNQINEAVKSIGDTYDIVKKGIGFIRGTTDTFDKIVIMQEDIATRIKQITDSMQELNMEGTSIKKDMLSLHTSNESIYNNILNISSSIQGLYLTSAEINEYIQGVNDKATVLTKYRK